MFAKSTEVAIAIMSRLAESYGEEARVSAQTIARDRDLPRPFVGKVLSTLAMAGLVSSVRGPGGGFALSRPPGEIRLLDLVVLFERSVRSRSCPVGGGICGEGEPCPVHAKFSAVQGAVEQLLEDTTLAVFTSGRTANAGRTRPGQARNRPATEPPKRTAKAGRIRGRAKTS